MGLCGRRLVQDKILILQMNRKYLILIGLREQKG